MIQIVAVIVRRLLVVLNLARSLRQREASFTTFGRFPCQLSNCKGAQERRIVRYFGVGWPTTVRTRSTTPSAVTWFW
jgi:hypothetical protein